ncbi:MAG: hypothetical protein MRJ67_01800 [Nitrospirales bacterium]|nr:hypothetical protein [Nitrospirales bacterium]
MKPLAHLLQVEVVMDERNGLRAIPLSGAHDSLAQASVSIDNHCCGKTSEQVRSTGFFLFIQEDIEMQPELLPKYFDLSWANIAVVPARMANWSVGNF